MSRTAGRAEKQSGPAKAAGSGGREAVVRTHHSPWARQQSRHTFGRRIVKEPGRRVGLPKELPESGLRRRGTLGDKDELQVDDDPVDDRVLGEERDREDPAVN